MGVSGFQQLLEILCRIGEIIQGCEYCKWCTPLSSLSAPGFILEALPEKLCLPAQHPRIDSAKTQRGVSATLVADRLRSVRKTFVVDSSKCSFSLNYSRMFMSY